MRNMFGDVLNANMWFVGCERSAIIKQATVKKSMRNKTLVFLANQEVSRQSAV